MVHYQEEMIIMKIGEVSILTLPAVERGHNINEKMIINSMGIDGEDHLNDNMTTITKEENGNVHPIDMTTK